MDPKRLIWRQWLFFLHKHEMRSKQREEMLLQNIRSIVPDNEKVGKLSISELQVMRAIGDKERVNVTTIAQQIGVTKSAISKITVKLLKKELLDRYQLEDNQKEVFFRLTPVGKMVYDIHKKYYQKLEQDVYRFLERYDSEELDFLGNFMKEATDELGKTPFDY